MGWIDLDSRACSIARTLEIVGDRWTLLILRDVFNGVRRFADLQRHLGIARNVLTQRLTALVDAGILVRIPYREPGTRSRHEYEPTDRGHELLSVLLTIIAWGDRHLADASGPPVHVRHTACGADVRLVPVCEAGHAIKSASEVLIEPGPGARPARRSSSVSSQMD
ncbi:winged helix-turn-helix transcriptional regulator [Nonomuraea sp. SYSU D8015]|uniref:winged helix-turn-helix transcriptional regulator n=1 Tax=Nonomuraea sp. SYSU D8015 TaxID=2593644 RepID=UPI001660A76B|nr:helix-turn-helix domain-containing protein [Nonomuraea sp. SYSU D8015]